MFCGDLVAAADDVEEGARNVEGVLDGQGDDFFFGLSDAVADMYPFADFTVGIGEGVECVVVHLAEFLDVFHVVADAVAEQERV